MTVEIIFLSMTKTKKSIDSVNHLKKAMLFFMKRQKKQKARILKSFHLENFLMATDNENALFNYMLTCNPIYSCIAAN